MRFSILVLALLASGCTLISDLHQEFNSGSNAQDPNKPYVVIIMLEGYRSDYTEKFQPPTLLAIKKQGVAANSFIPAYPSESFPVLYSIATGLYPENHGIVSGTFYDPDLGKTFRKTKKEDIRDGSWYGGTPFWVAAEKQKVLSATLFWPGSEAIIQGARPSYFDYADEELSNPTRVDQVTTWLGLPPDRRPHLVSLYLTSVDRAGHKYGTDSSQVKDAVFEVDRAIARLMKKSKEMGLSVNYFILSSNGMQDLNSKRIEYLEDFINTSGLKIMGEYTRWSLYFDDQHKKEKIYSELTQKPHHFQVYRREELPERLHYSKTKRSGDLIIAAEHPYSIRLGRENHRTFGAPFEHVAGHGYDPYTTPSMHGIFYAIGPAFKEQMSIPAFECIHFYPLLMKVMGLKTLTGIDGDEKVLSGILK